MNYEEDADRDDALRQIAAVVLDGEPCPPDCTGEYCYAGVNSRSEFAEDHCLSNDDEHALLVWAVELARATLAAPTGGTT